MSITEDQLRLYVDRVFDKYDKNGNFLLDQYQLYLFFNDLFASMKIKQKLTMEDVKYSLKQIDLNHDGKITKKQLFSALKIMLGRNQANNPPTPKNHQPTHQPPKAPQPQIKKPHYQSPPRQYRPKEATQNYQRKKSVPKNPHYHSPHHKAQHERQRQYLSPDMMNMMRGIGMGMLGMEDRRDQFPNQGAMMRMNPLGFW